MKIIEGSRTIRTSGLGSCVGVVIFDEAVRLAGMVHVMLPESSIAKGNDFKAAKFADTGVRELVRLLILQGGRMNRFKAKIAGGAQMFQFTSGNELTRIGPRNTEAVKQALSGLKIPLLAEDTGGSNGRTIEFNLDTFLLNVRTVNMGIKDI
ncbi:chemotaxis protein CheD [Bacillus salacetis]|uniref:Chemoreceptor glutamine deamidase CheD n=2 Tax=Bacillus salacetis TaxID=2315464 RepID=A0A3A1R319_9BACI|nr:chemotaxis protein CheD [Bacillus salacetis]